MVSKREIHEFVLSAVWTFICIERERERGQKGRDIERAIALPPFDTLSTPSCGTSHSY